VRKGGLILLLWLVIGLPVVFGFPLRGWGQSASTIRADDSLGTRVRQLENVFEVDEGTIVGRNQFHSFDVFDLGAGDSVQFDGPETLENILARVTGARSGLRASVIDGTLRSTIPGANLFLLNPAGLLFGPDASLDVAGSFHATTADRIVLADGTSFAARPGAPPAVLSAADVSAFEFSNAIPASIRVDQSVLAVPEGKSFGLVGGEIQIVGGPTGLIRARDGQILLASLRGPGTVSLDSDPNSAHRPPSQGGSIELLDDAFLDARGESGGSIRLSTGDLHVDASFIVSRATAGLGNANIELSVARRALLSDSLIDTTASGGDAGSIWIQAEDLRAIDTSIFTRTRGAGRAGDLSLVGASLSFDGASRLDAGSFAEGPGGDVRVVARAGLSATGSDFFSRAFESGRAGSVEIASGGDIRLSGGSQVATSAFASGRGGPIRISAAGTLSLVGTSEDRRFPTGLLANSLAEDLLAGDGGDISVRAGSIVVRDGGRISSLTKGGGIGGRLDIEALDSILVSGLSSDARFASFIAADADGEIQGSGRAGDIEIRTRDLSVLDGAAISSLTIGPARGGEVSIRASGLVRVVGATGEEFSAIATNAAGRETGAGDAGNLLIEAAALELLDGGRLGALSFGTGAGGSLTVRTTGDILVAGRNDPASVRSGISAAASGDVNAGPAGDLLIEARNVTLEGGGNVSSASNGEGAGGDVTIRASGTVRVSGTTEDGEFFSAIRANARGQSARAGAAGNVTVSAQSLEVLNGGDIGARTFGPGAGGDIRIDVEDGVVVSGREQGLVSAVSASASGSSSPFGDAGDVRIRARDVTVSDGGTVTSSSRGLGRGGEVIVQADRSVSVVGPSSIRTSATSAGDAGAVRVSGARISLEGGAEIASSSSGVGRAGSVFIAGGDVSLLGASLSTSAAVGAAVGTPADGNVEVQVSGELLLASGSRITASVDQGQGGDVRVGRPQSVVLRDGSALLAETAQGTGGQIAVDTKALLTEAGSRVSADAGVGSPGTVVLNSPDVNLDGGLLALSIEYANAARSLRPSCEVRAATEVGASLSVARQQGLPTSPEDLLLAFEGLDFGELSVLPPVGASDEDWIAAAEDAARSGNFERERAVLSEASSALALRGKGVEHADTLRGQAQAEQSLGRFEASIPALRQALEHAERSGDDARIAAALGGLGNAELALGHYDLAESLLTRAGSYAERASAPALVASIQINRGNAHAVRAEHREALQSYLEGADRARSANRLLDATKALANAARAALEAGESGQASELARSAARDAKQLEPSHTQASILIHLGTTFERLFDRSHADTELLAAYESLQAAIASAQQLDSPRILSYAYGNLGRLYQGENRREEALYLTRLALEAAERAAAPDSAYRWHWQEGQLLWAAGEPNSALTSYRRAVDILETTRHESQARYGSAVVAFRRAVAPVYLELADALLEGARRLGDDSRSDALLVEARATVEKLKAAELRDYLRDDCTLDLEARTQSLESVTRGSRTAVVYPIVLSDRVELLVRLPSGLKRYASSVSETQFRQNAREFRRRVQRPETDDYRASAEQLYGWLVKPYAPALAAAEIDTLVFVPDGILRTVPLAAMHDGSQFLIERFAVAITPGLSLVDPGPLNRENAKMVVAGLSQAVQGFPALPSVPKELATIGEVFEADRTLLDADFTADALSRAIVESRPTMLHLASHAEFTGDPRTSFLLTHDERLDLYQLAKIIGRVRFRERDPLELLLLSACETAIGNERAGLGLAGVAVRSGARSVVGSLWNISDRATAALVSAFYRELRSEGHSRAEALRLAQAHLLGQSEFAHPFYWSGLLLINNWL